MALITASTAWRESSAYLACPRQDAAFHAAIAAYAVTGWIVSILAHAPQKFLPFTYAGLLLTTTMPALLLLTICARGVRSLSGRSPLKTFGTGLFGPQEVASLVLLLNVMLFAATFVSVKAMLTDLVPFFADPYLANLDQFIHGIDPWLYAKALVPPQLIPVLGTFYFVGWTVLGWGALLAALFVAKLRPARSQYIWSFLIVWALLGNVIAGAVMSAGPIFYSPVTGDARFEALAAYIAEHSPTLAWSRAFLWRSHLGAEGITGADISAFPSMHLAQATLVVLLARRIHRWAFAAALVFLSVIFLGSVLLGWHYAVDGYFSIAATVLIWKCVGWLLWPYPTAREPVNSTTSAGESGRASVQR